MTFRRRSCLHAIAVGIAIALPSFLLISTNVQGALTDKTISGHVYDQNSQPINGASVSIEIWGGYWPDRDTLRISDSTVTNTWGYYEVTINSNYWDPHNTIIVHVTYGITEETRIVEADGDQYQTVDVSMGIVIPELSGLIGLPTTIVGCMITIVILLVCRRSGALKGLR